MYCGKHPTKLVNFVRFNIADEANYKTGDGIDKDEETTWKAYKGEKLNQRYLLWCLFVFIFALGLIKKKNVQVFIK